MKIIGKIIKIGKKLKDRTILINKFQGKIVIHNTKPDTIVEIFAKLSEKDKAELLGFTEEKSYHKEGRV